MKGDTLLDHVHAAVIGAHIRHQSHHDHDEHDAHKAYADEDVAAHGHDAQLIGTLGFGTRFGG